MKQHFLSFLRVALSIFLAFPPAASFAQMQEAAGAAGRAAPGSGAAGAAANGTAAGGPQGGVNVSATLQGALPGAPVAGPVIAPKNPTVAGFVAARISDLSKMAPSDAVKHVATLRGLEFKGENGPDLSAINDAITMVRMAVAQPEALDMLGKSMEADLGTDAYRKLRAEVTRLHADPAAKAEMGRLHASVAAELQARLPALFAKVSSAWSKEASEAAGSGWDEARKADDDARDAIAGQTAARANALKPAGRAVSDSPATAAPAPVSSPNMGTVRFSGRSSAVARAKTWIIGGLAALTLTLSAAMPWTQPSAAPTAPQSQIVALVQKQVGQNLMWQRAQTAQGQYVQVDRVSEIPEALKSTPGAQVFVKGNVGLSESAIAEIQAQVKGKHWIIIIAEDFNNEEFTDVEGNHYRNIRAVEFAAHQGVFNQLGDWKHPETGEADGAVLTIVLKKYNDDFRRLFLKTSEAQSSRGMDGERNFKGDLDQYAIERMKAGGDIVGAVRNTVAGIDGRLNSAIANVASDARSAVAQAEANLGTLGSETRAFRGTFGNAGAGAIRSDLGSLQGQLQAAKQALAAKKYVEAARIARGVSSTAQADLSSMGQYQAAANNAATAVANAESAVGAFAGEVAAFQRANPNAKGDIGSPNVAAVRDQVKAARQSLSKSDYASANSQAGQALSSISSARALMNEYAGGAAAIQTQADRVESLKGHPFSGAASDRITVAEDLIKQARDQYANGDSKYKASVAAAESEINQGVSAAANAQSEHSRNVFVFWLLVALGSLLTLGTGIGLGVNAKRARRRTDDLLTEWDTAMDVKSQKLLDELTREMTLFIGKPGRYDGKTAKIAEAVRTSVGFLTLLWPSAKGVLNDARALAHPSNPFKRAWNFFFGGLSVRLGPISYDGAYVRAERMLGEDKITFSGDDEEALRRVFQGEKKNWEEELFGDLKSYGRLSFTFQELIARFNAEGKSAAEGITTIKTARTNAEPTVKAVADSIAASEKTKTAIDQAGQADGLFLVPSLYSTLLPRASKALGKTRDTIEKDPVGALEKHGAEAQRLVADAEAIANLVSTTRAGALKTIVAASAALEAGGVETGWIDKEVRRLSGRAEALAVKGAEEGVAEKVATLQGQLDAFAAKTARAAELNKIRLEKAEPDIAKTTAAVAAARARIGAALGLDPSKILSEKNANPDGDLAASAAHVAEIVASLGKGEVEAAEASLAGASKEHAEGAALLKLVEGVFASHESTVAERRSRTGELKGKVPEAETSLGRIQKKFAKSVLSLGSGDAGHPNANGTIEDNIEEATSNVSSAEEKLEKAIAAFRAGKLVLSSDLLTQIAAHQDFIANRLGEVHEKEARLEKAVVANRATVGALEVRSKEYSKTYKESFWIMAPTFKALEKAAKQLVQAREIVEEAKGDPFKAEAALDEVRAALDHVNGNLARNDRDIYNEADRSVKAAVAQYEAAVRLGNVLENDGHGDSDDVKRGFAALRELYNKLGAVQTELKTAHNDWHAVDAEADRLAAEGARVAAALNHEIKEVEEAVNAISRASSKVREAGSWSGSYTSISGSPGSDTLSRARSLLEAGRYDDAERAANDAYRRAADEISAADAREAAAYAEHQRRLAAERRRREEEEAAERRRRDSYSSSSSGSSWSSGSSGGGSSGWSSGGSSGGGSSGW